MNKGKIYQHLHGLGLNGEQSLQVLQLVTTEVLRAVDDRIARDRPRSYRTMNELLTRLRAELGPNFDEQTPRDEKTPPAAMATS